MRVLRMCFPSLYLFPRTPRDTKIRHIWITRNLSYKKLYIRNENGTSSIFASFKERTSPFISNDYIVHFKDLTNAPT